MFTSASPWKSLLTRTVQSHELELGDQTLHMWRSQYTLSWIIVYQIPVKQHLQFNDQQTTSGTAEACWRAYHEGLSGEGYLFSWIICLRPKCKSRVKADKFENPETMLGTQKTCLAIKPKCLSNGSEPQRTMPLKTHVLKAHFLARLMYHRRSLQDFVCFFNLFKAELSQKRYWQGPRSQELGEGDFMLTATLSPPEWLLLKMGSKESFWWFIICVGQSHKTASTDHNFWRERAKAESMQGPPAYQHNALLLGQTSSCHSFKARFPQA